MDIFKKAVSIIPGVERYHPKTHRELYNRIHTGGALANFHGIKTWDVSAVESMRGVFQDSWVASADLSEWSIGHVDDFSNMFFGCRLASSLNLSGWQNTNSHVNMKKMFHGCNSLRILNLDNWGFNKIIHCAGMFQNCALLTKINLTGAIVCKDATDLSNMFFGCISLLKLELADWDVSGVRNFRTMFHDCRSLRHINLSGWNVSANAENMDSMFSKCSSLLTADLSNWEVGNVINMECMFKGCTELTKLVTTGWNVQNVRNFSQMFEDCKCLPSNIQEWELYDDDHVNTFDMFTTKRLTSHMRSLISEAFLKPPRSDITWEEQKKPLPKKPITAKQSEVASPQPVVVFEQLEPSAPPLPPLNFVQPTTTTISDVIAEWVISHLFNPQYQEELIRNSGSNDDLSVLWKSDFVNFAVGRGIDGEIVSDFVHGAKQPAANGTLLNGGKQQRRQTNKTKKHHTKQKDKNKHKTKNHCSRKKKKIFLL
jgi:surface protein